MRNLGMGAGCSALSWTTEDGKHLWGRNFDYNRIAPGSRVTFAPRGTVYDRCIAPGGEQAAGTQSCAVYAAVGTGLLLPASPILYEGINEAGLMGGQLYYREFAHFPAAARPGTQPTQPPLLVYDCLAQCASVAEVVQRLEHTVTLVDAPLYGTVPPLHWSFSDRTGESIVIEPDRDGLHLYRNALGVMTNSPPYPWHRLHLLNFTGVRDLDRGEMEWEGENLSPCFSGSGAQGLPGDWGSPSRFVRLCFLRKYGVRGRNETQGVSRMLRLFQSAAFPLGMVRVADSEPKTVLGEYVGAFDYTVYTAIACAESRRYYWTTYENQRVRFVDLAALLERTTPVQFDLDTPPDFLQQMPD